MAPFPSLAGNSSWSDAVTGAWLPVRAARLMLTTPKVLGWSLGCALVTAATLVVLAVWWWPLSQHWGELLVGNSAGWQRATGSVVGFVLFVLLYGVSALTVPNVVLAPLQDPLSEATEVACGDFTPPPFSFAATVHGVSVSLRHTALRLLFMALGFVALLPLNFIPVVGNTGWLVGSTVWSMFWLAAEHLSNPAARHLHPFGQVVRALRKRPFLALGFGASLWVLLWVPVVNFFLVPVAVVAGTLLFRSLRAVGVLTQPTRSAPPAPTPGTNG